MIINVENSLELVSSYPVLWRKSKSDFDHIRLERPCWFQSRDIREADKSVMSATQEGFSALVSLSMDGNESPGTGYRILERKLGEDFNLKWNQRIYTVENLMHESSGKWNLRTEVLLSGIYRKWKLICWLMNLHQEFLLFLKPMNLAWILTEFPPLYDPYP